MSSQSQVRWIALLRGINVGGHNKMPMAELRNLCAGLGWQNVATYIQSGNILFSAEGSTSALEKQLAGAIASHFGHRVSVIVRPAAAWPLYIELNPFPEASASEPNRVMLGLAQKSLAADAAERLSEFAASGESIAQRTDSLWIHYASGSARSKITPALLDRLAGSPVTTRNWRTVLKINEMIG
ncbi:DUF1697 domain-containing protein [Wenzhouxiangella sp. XN201]|uniref:DUF1697 domain-containing protein n=1 Tax=Wenzhouxiangella sp. XN201 TaxID=2710755 RepID=UPI0013CB7072|nr:DUF1697 domain-containing protein [Wenzhouxiangella sp. XN201]NEZ04627.1 DUF1697 domain-containing protein [Wenzhouxiangella sp. XN201]